MDIVASVISDLHLGSTSSRPADVLSFLRGRKGRLVVNGDLLDDPEGPLSFADQDALRALRDSGAIWVRGNHDGQAWRQADVLGMSLQDSVALTAGGRRVLVTHGHQWDPYLSDYPALTDLGNYLNLGLSKLSPRLAARAKRLRKFLFRADFRVMNGAVLEAVDRGFDSVVCGHTHFAVPPCEDRGRVYVNGGSWCEERLTWVAVWEDGGVSLEEFHP